MRRLFSVAAALLLAASTVGATAAAQPDPVARFDAQRAHVYSSAAGGSLLDSAAAGTPSGLVAAFLRAHGKSAATIASLRRTAQFTNLGVTHAFFDQSIGGLRVAGAYVRAAVNARGQLVDVIENIVDVRADVATTSVTASRALAAALTKSHPEIADRPGATGSSGNVTTFRQTAAFAASPTAERVIVARESGALEQGFSVQTWTRKNSLDVTLVDRGGQAAQVESRTANDSYNVFTEDPLKTPQAVVPGPGTGNAQSPAGWLSGSQLTTHITGNNVNTYLDRDANNKPDPGGTPVTNGNFLTTANLGVAPTTTDNQAVAVQNLFYLNNTVHDILYSHGFTEAVGNFQTDNFGNGGKGGDPVLAEAQDGSGTDNANFATPPDGRSGRMQMYLWTGAGANYEVVTGAGTFDAAPAEFGPQLNTTGVTGPIVLVDDGVAGGTTSDGCEAMPRGSLSGQIALVDRGFCTFVTKVANVAGAGATAMIVANNAAGPAVPMGGTVHGLKISSVMISQADGITLKAGLPTSGTMRLKAVLPLQIDGDLDSDVVFHEYGHGLTWRMIGGMDGPLAGAIGEGASDGVALQINGDDVVGEYAASDPGGIRRFPYHNYPNTYSAVTGAEVHNDGEIYAAVVWLLVEEYAADPNVDGNDLFNTWVDGFNYTPSTPAYEDMRDGMLASVAARSAPNQECLIWDAFAHYGIGVGASGTVNHQGVVSITESFDVPPQCAP